MTKAFAIAGAAAVGALVAASVAEIRDVAWAVGIISAVAMAAALRKDKPDDESRGED